MLVLETHEIAQLKALILAQKEDIAVLKAVIADLTARLSKNSANSSKPPSSDGLIKKPLIKPALPKQGGKKPGGQPGHPGKMLCLIEQSNLIHRHQPTQCEQCGLHFQGLGEVVHQWPVFDLPQSRLFVEEHQVLTYSRACCCMSTGHFPARVDTPVQYGPRIEAQSVLLNVEYQVPFAKIQQFWDDLMGYKHNPNTLVSVQMALTEQLIPIEQQIKGQLTQALVYHFDETGVRVGGMLQWLDVASNQHYTHLFIHPNRGRVALLSAKSIIHDFLNWTVHDRWASYSTVGQVCRVLCGAHLLRELAG